MSGRDRRGSRLYVGNLPPDCRSRDLDDLFQKFGRINFIDLKRGYNNSASFAFIEFEDSRDADDAIHRRDGYQMDGRRIRVEFCRGRSDDFRHDGRRNDIGGRSDRDHGGSRYASSRGRYGPPTRRSDYRVVVSGLPKSGSWQDLKDHMREAGDVCFADVYRDNTGVVEFLRYDDMKYAIEKMNDSKFTSHEGETVHIQVRAHSQARESSRRRRHSSSESSRRSPRNRSRSPVKSPPTRDDGKDSKHSQSLSPPPRRRDSVEGSDEIRDEVKKSAAGDKSSDRDDDDSVSD
ncbi:hypothetical protein ACOME3_007493 [Neoechinorhynchus agilis]